MTMPVLAQLRSWMGVRDAANPELEFLDRASELTARPPSPVAARIALVICVAVGAAAAGLWFGRVDIYATAPGRIQPLGRSKVIQPMDPGRVLSIAVRNGAHVQSGDLLAELDSSEPSADLDASTEQAASLAAEIAMRQAAVAAARRGQLLPVPAIAFPADTDAATRAREQAYLQASLENLDQRVRALDAQVAEKRTEQTGLRLRLRTRQQVIDTLDERVRMRSQLEAEGWDSKSNLIDAQENYNRENTELAADQADLEDTAAQATTLVEQQLQILTGFIDTNEQSISDAQSKLVVAQRDLAKSDARVRDTRLVAPISGTVQDLDLTTIGQVVSSGQQLMTIVPDAATLQVETAVANADVGFVRPGQRVVLKVDAFPFTKYGVIEGTVVRVARDAVDGAEAQALADRRSKGLTADQSAAAPSPALQNLVFPVTVDLDRTWLQVDGRRTYLTPGMTLTAEIKTGDRRAIEYLLAPFLETASDAFHER